MAFAAKLAISPAPRTPSARSKRALRFGGSAYTSSSGRASAKEEDAWGREQIANWHGSGERTVGIGSETAVWYSTGLFAVPLR